MNMNLPVESGALDFENAALYYETAGAGAPVVFVHAGIADRRMWDGQFAVFAERYRAIRYDQRGFGRTTAQPAAHSHLRDLTALLDHLGVERAHFVGCSKGGRLIADFALAHPARVLSLVMVNSSLPGFQHTGPQPPQWAEIEASFDRGDLERANELEIQVWIDGAQRTPAQVDPTVRALALEMNLIALRNDAAGLGDEERPSDGAGRLGEIIAPLLAIASDLDDPDFIRAAEFAVANVVGARMAVISGAAHLPSLEQPEAFNRVVLEFLDGLGPNPTNC
jgi:pimeloyl-ACP methyl ester carboxylesterase